jgi:glycosyltransferase involved in cell wall biosynthesis
VTGPSHPKIVLFCEYLSVAGGAERLLLEEAVHFSRKSASVNVLTFEYAPTVLFDGTYDVHIEQIERAANPSNALKPIGAVKSITTAIRNAFHLKKRIRELQPDIILASDPWDCIFLYLATLFTPYIYASDIHGTIFWFKDNLAKYSFIHRRTFREIRESVIGHQQFIPVNAPKSSITYRILQEFAAVGMYLGVRKAKKLFVLSNHMQWEVNKLYGKQAVVVKGGLSEAIFNYKPRMNCKERLGITAEQKLILNVNRLDPRKRIDMLLKSFKLLCDRRDDVFLGIGGTGPDEDRLKQLTQQLDLGNKVKFLGYIKEGDLWDWLASCDVFVHPNWADFAIAAYEPLALQKKVVWSTEMELDHALEGDAHIFTANPTPEDFAATIEQALDTEIQETIDVSMYAWDIYCDKILNELKHCIHQNL